MAARSIYVHAGMHKTGTSSIQRALAVNREQLDGSGITVWDIDENHSIPLQFLVRDFRRLKEPRQRVRAAAAARRYGTPEMVRERLISALKSSRPKFVISGEALCVIAEPGLCDIIRLLEKQSSEIVVVIYVREPTSLVHSIAQARLKAGETLDLIVSKVPFFGYRDKLEKFLRVLGRDRVRLRLYRPFNDGDLLADFFDALDERPEVAEKFPRPILNRSMSQSAAIFLNTLNSLAKEENRSGLSQRFANSHLARCFDGPPFRLSGAEVERIMKANHQDIEWISGVLGCDLVVSGTGRNSLVSFEQGR